MRAASYNEIAGSPWAGQPGLLKRLLPFVGNSMAAGWNLQGEGRSYYRFGRPYESWDLERQTREAAEEAARPGDKLVYVVWSYATEVAVHDPETGESWVSKNYWGQTTGRHLGYARRALPRVRSNDPSALDGIGPNSPVTDAEDPGPAVGKRRGRVIETHPLAGAVRVRFEGWPTPEVVPVGKVVLA